MSLLRKLLILWLVWCSQAGFSEDIGRISDSLMLRVGTINYKTEGLEQLSATQNGLYSLEYSHYWHKDLSSFFAYRAAERSDIKRTFYQATAAGFRYYPYTLGVPIGGRLEYNVIKYDAWFKPYFELGGSLGRYLLRIAGDPPIFDVSSQFFGIFGGLGMHLQLNTRTALDMSVTMERDTGFNSPLFFRATNILGLIGLMRYF